MFLVSESASMFGVELQYNVADIHRCTSTTQIQLVKHTDRLQFKYLIDPHKQSKCNCTKTPKENVDLEGKRKMTASLFFGGLDFTADQYQYLVRQISIQLIFA